MNELTDWAVVTGGSSGIGRATVKVFLERGLDVLVIDRNSDAEVAIGSGLSEQAAGRLRFVVEDVNDFSERTHPFKRLIEGASRRVGHLVNCAADFTSVGVGGSRDDWIRSLATNLVSPARLADQFASVAPPSSTIVNVASISGHIAQPGRWAYNAGKAGLLSLTRSLALDFSQRKIRVNTVSPGWTWTPEVEKAAAGLPEDAIRAWDSFQPSGRVGQANEIAAAIAFLSSEESSFVNGAELLVDGGYMAIGPEGIGSRSHFAS